MSTPGDAMRRTTEQISVARPSCFSGGKRLFDGFDQTVVLEHVRVLQSPFATHISYRIVR